MVRTKEDEVKGGRKGGRKEKLIKKLKDNTELRKKTRGYKRMKKEWKKGE